MLQQVLAKAVEREDFTTESAYRRSSYDCRKNKNKMVFVKISDGREIRKLQITDPQISFSELKRQVATLFPSLGEGAEFELRYYDSDGDMIALSSDGELQTALAHLPPDAVWRLEIVRPRQTTLARPPSVTGADFSEPRWLRRPFGDIDPFWTPRSVGPLWREPMREWGNVGRSIEREMDQQMERMRRMHEEHTRRFEEQRRKAEEEIRQVLQEQQRRESQLQRQRSQEAGGTGEVTQAGRPQWHCQTFGSWEPVTYEAPHGSTRTVVGPVGYHMYWGYSDPEPMDEEPQAAAPKEQETEEKTEV